MKTIILILNDRRVLERVENQTFDNIESMIEGLKVAGMVDEQELSYFELSYFMEGVNDQEIDDLTNTFIGYVHLSMK